MEILVNMTFNHPAVATGTVTTATNKNDNHELRLIDGMTTAP